MPLTIALIQTACGATLENATNFLAPLQAACDKYEINTPQRIAAFLANVGIESGGLTVLRENMNYSAMRLAQVWPFRYAISANASPREPNALALRLSGNPEAIANNVYANRLGNGDETTGDGYRYRGGGLIQITGKGVYQATGNAIGVDLMNNPEQISTPAIAALSAAYYFYARGCNLAADKGDISRVIQIINGQPPCTANLGGVRITRYNDALALLNT